MNWCSRDVYWTIFKHLIMKWKLKWSYNWGLKIWIFEWKCKRWFWFYAYNRPWWSFTYALIIFLKPNKSSVSSPHNCFAKLFKVLKISAKCEKCDFKMETYDSSFRYWDRFGMRCWVGLYGHLKIRTEGMSFGNVEFGLLKQSGFPMVTLEKGMFQVSYEHLDKSFRIFVKYLNGN